MIERAVTKTAFTNYAENFKQWVVTKTCVLRVILNKKLLRRGEIKISPLLDYQSSGYF